VNESRRDFTVVEGGLRFGLAAIKNVGDGAIESIRQAREVGNPFRSLADLCRRIDLRKVNRRVIEGLIQSGALDSTGAARAAMMAGLERVMEESAVVQRDREQGQSTLFGGAPVAGGAPAEAALPDVPEWDEAQRLRMERESIGFYVTNHPLTRYERDMREFANATTETVEDMPDGREVKLCGLITSQRVTTTKKGDKMAYARLEDLHGAVEVLIFPDLYRKVSGALSPDAPLVVTGTVDKGEKGVKLKGLAIEPLTQARARQTRRVEIVIPSAGVSGGAMQALRDILRSHPGDCPIYLRVELPEKRESVIAVDDALRVRPTDHFIDAVEHRFGRGTVVLK
jgi:DNA polymerase-3 subunit alpha